MGLENSELTQDEIQKRCEELMSIHSLYTNISTSTLLNARKISKIKEQLNRTGLRTVNPEAVKEIQLLISDSENYNNQMRNAIEDMHDLFGLDIFAKYQLPKQPDDETEDEVEFEIYKNWEFNK